MIIVVSIVLPGIFFTWHNITITDSIELPAKRARLSIQDTESLNVVHVDSKERMDTSAGKEVSKDQVCTISMDSPSPKSHQQESENVPQHSTESNGKCRVQPECIKESQDKLTVNDLATVQRAVWDGRAKWYNIGLELGLKPGTLDAIEKKNFHDTDDCFRATLHAWLSSEDLCPSWRHLADALRAPPVGMWHLAEEISNSHTL